MSEPDEKDQLWSEATLWFARMRSPDAEDFRVEFEEWLARGALHRRYYNRASEHWLHGTAAYAEERAQVQGARIRPSQGTSEPQGKRRAIAALVAASVFIAGSTYFYIAREQRDTGPGSAAVSGRSAPSGFVQFAATTGEQRAVRLSDGSVVTLSGDTLLRAQFEPSLRRLTLDRGSARFDVAHEARPFVVFAGGGSVTAHGTVFDVSVNQDHRVSVRLIKGSIDVQLPPIASAGRRTERWLKPGEALTFQTSPTPISVRGPASPSPGPADPAHEYRDILLADIVNEANRHSAVPIRFADPAIGGHVLSGRFRTDDAALLAERVAALLDLTVDRRNSAEMVLRSK